MNKNRAVRTRFAPSPTGFLHLGGARTALFNWLWARKNGGQFLLRIEDTDEARNTTEAVEQIFKSLQWLGIDWDEEVIYQSKRLALYQQKIDELWQRGLIYPAFESRDELEAAKEAAEAKKQTYIYDGPSRHLSSDEGSARMMRGEEFVWRFRTPSTGDTLVPETLMGDAAECRFANAEIGDFILTRPVKLTAGDAPNLGMPLYNFCNVVDDAATGITHVIRGVEHLTNAAKQVLLYQAFGYELPHFTHLPLIMKAGKKMSKRDADADAAHPVSIMARAELGYLPEAMLNFLALLGWSFGGDRELASASDVLAAFSLERLQKSNANFDEDKFLHFNAHYLQQMQPERLYAEVRTRLLAAGYDLSQHSDVWLQKLIALELPRAKLLQDFVAHLDYFFMAPAAYDAENSTKLFTAEAEGLLNAMAAAFAAVPEFTALALEEALKALAEQRGLKLKQLAPLARLAVTGKAGSHPLYEMLALLGRDEVCARLERAAAFAKSAKQTG